MSRHTRHILAGLAMAAALLTTGTARVGACSCIERQAACASAWETDAIFVGKVLSISPAMEPGGRMPAPERLVRFEVQETFKGAPLGEIDTFTGSSSASCGYNFIAGRTYIVYAYRNATTGRLWAGICSRTGPIEQATEDLAYFRGSFIKPAEQGSIRGRVTRYDPPLGPNQPQRQAPFPGADIRLEGYSRAYTTASADDGSYEFRVPAGEYRLFATVRDGVYAWPGAEGRTVWLRDARGCGVMDIVVKPDSRITGRLLDEAGRPVPFMSVELATERQIQSAFLSPSSRTLTNDRGRFEFTQLAPGSYAPGLTLRRTGRNSVDTSVWISRDGSPTPVATAVESEGRADIGDVRLPAGVSTITLTGVVVTQDGRPVAGAQVRFIDPGPAMGTTGVPMTTAEDGRFSLSVIAGRTYRLSAEWFAPTTGQRRYVSARSDAFDAVGEIKPFRLVLGEVR